MSGSRAFIVYSRRGCHLCEDLIGELEPLLSGRGRLEIRDVDDNPDWVREYGLRVPVVVCDDDEICQYNLDRQAVLNRLAAS